MRLVVSMAASLLIGPLITPIAAQTPQDEPETRAELLQRQREEKQRHLEPYEPNPVERGMILTERPSGGAVRETGYVRNFYAQVAAWIKTRDLTLAREAGADVTAPAAATPAAPPAP